MTNETHLTGLEGTNPLGFLAALGVQVAFASEPQQPRLWWSEDVIPHAVIDGNFTIDQVAAQALDTFATWRESSAINPRRSDGTIMPKGDELKLAPEDIRTYLDQASLNDLSSALITALVAEGSLDKQGVAKPSDFYFTAGGQKFLTIVRDILGNASQDDVLEGIQGQWSYQSKTPSLMWDVSDDRVYSLAADNPSNTQKLTNPGPEALAVLGLSLHPVFAGRDRTLTQGCSGKWKAGFYSWPLWRKPASLQAVQSLLAHAYDHPIAKNQNRDRWYCAWGISRILRSPIRRSSQGGYGTFGPPAVVYQALEHKGKDI